MTSPTVTLTILVNDDPDGPPAHESTHPSVAAAVAALEAVLQAAGEGDRAVDRDDESVGGRHIYDLVDPDGQRVGTAVIDGS